MTLNDVTQNTSTNMYITHDNLRKQHNDTTNGTLQYTTQMLQKVKWNQQKTTDTSLCNTRRYNAMQYNAIQQNKHIRNTTQNNTTK